MVMGFSDPTNPATASNASFKDIVIKAREGDHTIPVKLVGDIGVKDPFITLPASETLARLVEILASGVHRVAITKDNSDDVIGVLSQRKVVKYFWEHVRSFIDLEPSYSKQVPPKTIQCSDLDRRTWDRVK
jgi:CBS domain